MRHLHSLYSGQHLQYDNDQLSEGGRVECDAVVGDLLHLFCIRSSVRIRDHPAPDENQNIPEVGRSDSEGRDLQNGRRRFDRVPCGLPHL